LNAFLTYAASPALTGKQAVNSEYVNPVKATTKAASKNEMGAKKPASSAVSPTST
jgi:hypothetical protein